MLTHFRTPGRDARIGAEVSRLRRDRKMSQTDLAKATGMSLSMLSKLEIGARHWTLEAISEVARVLKVPAALIFGMKLDVLSPANAAPQDAPIHKPEQADEIRIEPRKSKKKGGKKHRRDRETGGDVIDLSRLPKERRELVVALYTLLAA